MAKIFVEQPGSPNKTLLPGTSLYKAYGSEVHLLNQHYLNIGSAVCQKIVVVTIFMIFTLKNSLAMNLIMSALLYGQTEVYIGVKW